MAGWEEGCLSLQEVTGGPSSYKCLMMMVKMMMVMVACRHIPTMTKSHHGGEMSVMVKVGKCQCQIPNIHDNSFSTRPQC